MRKIRKDRRQYTTQILVLGVPRSPLFAIIVKVTWKE